MSSFGVAVGVSGMYAVSLVYPELNASCASNCVYLIRMLLVFINLHMQFFGLHCRLWKAAFCCTWSVLTLTHSPPDSLESDRLKFAT